MKKIIFGVLGIALVLIGIISFKEKPAKNSGQEPQYEILQKWDLPAELNEISGITWIGEDRIACVQDEDGIIFIYNLKTSEIESQTRFGNDGDYEGITVLNSTAYVLRSDGIIFEVLNFTGKDPRVNKHVTGPNKLNDINMEGLCADAINNRLILAVKEGKDFKENKGVFDFDLKEVTSGNDPLFILNSKDPIFKNVKEDKKGKFSPGEIGIHPKTGEYYILDGTNPKLLIAQMDGTLKDLILFSSTDFENPEGLTFSGEGDLYISNEAESGPANILKISLRRVSK